MKSKQIIRNQERREHDEQCDYSTTVLTKDFTEIINFVDFMMFRVGYIQDHNDENKTVLIAKTIEEIEYLDKWFEILKTTPLDFPKPL